MKKVIKVCIVIVLLIVTMLGLGYLGLAYYYQNGFSFQTYINGVYCTGKSVEEVNKELSNAYDYEGLTIETLEGTYTITTKELSYAYDYREPLEYFLSQQISLLWIRNIFIGDSFHMNPKVTYDEAVLNDFFEETVLQDSKRENYEVSISVGEDGFLLSDGKENLLDEALAYETICKALDEGVSFIHLYEAGCYYNKPYSEKEQELVDFYYELNRFQNKEVCFQFGDEIERMDPKTLASMLTCYEFFQTKKTILPTDYKESFYEEYTEEEETIKRLAVDDDKVFEALNCFFDPYNTYGNHTFQTHDGRVLHIEDGTYGNQIKIKTELQEFKRFIESDKQEYQRMPEYSKEALYKGKDDIGPTYIEIDIGNQKMFYFENEELVYETDVVTGKHNATPECVCYVYNKQKNRVLRGPGYASPVKFWMPVIRGVGIHDASWRDEYGGDIYISNGSHGCINTPYDIVSQMYERVEIGTPVIMYYGLEKDE